MLIWDDEGEGSGLVLKDSEVAREGGDGSRCMELTDG